MDSCALLGEEFGIMLALRRTAWSQVSVRSVSDKAVTATIHGVGDGWGQAADAAIQECARVQAVARPGFHRPGNGGGSGPKLRAGA